MRYKVLRPASPTDPRKLSFGSIDGLCSTMMQMNETDLEQAAIDMVRDSYPDAVVMPVPTKVGSGEVWLLGVLENIRAPSHPEGVLPFVMFVHAVAENGADRKLIDKRKHFNRAMWKLPVHKPVAHQGIVRAELRATDLEDPRIVEVLIGRLADERFVLSVELNGVAMSLAFGKEVSMSTSEPRASLPADDHDAEPRTY